MGRQRPLRLLAVLASLPVLPCYLGGTGFCVFSAECFALLRAKYTAQTSVGDLCDFMNLLVENGRKGIAVHIAAEEINVNDPGMYGYAEQRLERAGHE